MLILIPNKTTESRLIAVVDLMRDIGSPIIECIKIGNGKYLALEGSHRVTAAKMLGFEPVLNVITECDCGEPDLEWVHLEATRRKKKGLQVNFDSLA